MDYKVTRERDGLQVETCIPLGFDRRELQITTHKFVRGIGSFAQVVQRSEDGVGYSFMLCGDYRKQLVVDKAARATEKTIRAMHEAALQNVAAVEAEARAFYAQKEAA